MTPRDIVLQFVESSRILSPRAELQLLPIRWVLDAVPPHPHCAACLHLAGEYVSYHHMIGFTGGAVPGYFPTYANATDFILAGRIVACNQACRCRLEVEIDGIWQPFESPAQPQI